VRVKNLNNLKHEIEQANPALDDNDLFQVQYDVMSARFYKSVSGL
jgi:hypothetical protein